MAWCKPSLNMLQEAMRSVPEDVLDAPPCPVPAPELGLGEMPPRPEDFVPLQLSGGGEKAMEMSSGANGFADNGGTFGASGAGREAEHLDAEALEVETECATACANAVLPDSPDCTRQIEECTTNLQTGQRAPWLLQRDHKLLMKC